MAQPRTPWDAFDYAVVHVEGNGHQHADLVEIAIAPLESGAIGVVETWLVRPMWPLPASTTSFLHLLGTDLATAPTTAQIAPELCGALNGMVTVSHSANADLEFLARELPAFRPRQIIDTRALAQTLLPGRTSYELEDLAEDFALTDDLPAIHEPSPALQKAIVCARLLSYLADYGDDTVRTLTDLLKPAAAGRAGQGSWQRSHAARSRPITGAAL